MGIAGAGLGDRGRVVGVGPARPGAAAPAGVSRGVRTPCRGWRPERELFGRLMKYGGPAGAQVFLDVLVFNVFVQLVGRLGEAAMGATTLTVRLNMVAFLPMMGLGQAVCILVGQRLGADRPDLAERSAYTGLKWVVRVHVRAWPPSTCSSRGCSSALFEGDRDPDGFAAVAAIVPTLLVVRGGLLAGGRGERDVLVRPAGGRRHPVRLAADVRPGLADHGGADVPGGPGRAAASTGRGGSRRRTSSPWPSASTCGSAPASGRPCASSRPSRAGDSEG